MIFKCPKEGFKVLQSIDDLASLDPKSINSQSYAHDNEIKRRKQAELLIGFFTHKYLKYVICPSDMVKMTEDTNAQVITNTAKCV